MIANSITLTAADCKKMGRSWFRLTRQLYEKTLKKAQNLTKILPIPPLHAIVIPFAMLARGLRCCTQPFHSGTTGRKMNIKPVNTNPAAGERRPVRLPVPVGEIRAPGMEGNLESPPATRAFAARERRAGRASAPFLAQLSLQYDDGAFRRRARLERSGRAARAYDAALVSRPGPVKGEKANIRV